MADVYDITKDLWGGGHGQALASMPARRGIAVTPSDTNDVTNASGDAAPCYAKALFVGVSGNVTVVHAADNGNSGAGTAVTYSNVPVGWFPVQVRRVMATNTTATNIVGLYDQ